MCILISVGLAMTLYSDEPRSIAFEDCQEKEIRVTYMDTEEKLNVLKYDEYTGIYIVELKK